MFVRVRTLIRSYTNECKTQRSDNTYVQVESDHANNKPMKQCQQAPLSALFDTRNEREHQLFNDTGDLTYKL